LQSASPFPRRLWREGGSTFLFATRQRKPLVTRDQFLSGTATSGPDADEMVWLVRFPWSRCRRESPARGPETRRPARGSRPLLQCSFATSKSESHCAVPGGILGPEMLTSESRPTGRKSLAQRVPGSPTRAVFARVVSYCRLPSAEALG